MRRHSNETATVLTSFANELSITLTTAALKREFEGIAANWCS
jgi:hypothetical protein